MTRTSENIVSLDAFRKAGPAMSVPSGTIRYGTAEQSDVVEITGMHFADVGKWLTEQARIRETIMVQARITFSGGGDGLVAALVLPPRPEPSMMEAMPFEVSNVAESAAMLKAYDYLVSENRMACETIIAGFSDDWVALETTKESHGRLPAEAYEKTKA